MLKKPFKAPENRECKYCGDEFIAIRPTWKCTTCLAKESMERNKEKRKIGLNSNGKVLKSKYPYNDTKNSRFGKLRSELKYMDFREDWKEYFVNRLDTILEDRELMAWITDRRDSETLNEKRNNKYGIAAVVAKQKWPDTRQMND